MEGAKKLIVNGREYTITMLSPSRAHDFYYDVTAAEARRESMKEYARIAIGQCHDSMMRPLSESANFLKCFSDHPEDLILLGNMARMELVLPFLPNSENTEKTENG